MPNTRPTDILNNPARTNITKPTARMSLNTMVPTNGARFMRLLFHKASNSMLWFFFTTMARRNGAMQRMVQTAPNSDAHNGGRLLRKKGMRKRNERMMTAMDRME